MTRREGVVEYYLSADTNGRELTVSPFDREHPFRAVVSDDEDAPQFRYLPVPSAGHPEKIRIKVRVTDVSGVASVTLYYKELPSYLRWKSIEMKPVGKGVYETEVPLTRHGLMYRFEAADVWNNATIFPDQARRTPYYVIEAWK